MKKIRIQYADDDTSSIRRLLKLRIPSLLCGLVLGFLLSFVASRFEAVLAENIAVAFFIPFIVYLADAVGTQTQNIYARDLKSGKASFKTYFLKESVLGVVLGLIFASLTALILMLWFQSVELTLAVSLGVLGAIASAPLIALIICEVLELEREDPAVWAGPIATVVQDTVSVLIYGLIATVVIL